MAYVAITDTLIYTVKNQLAALQQAELAQLGDLNSLAVKCGEDAQLRQMITERLWEGMDDLKDRLLQFDRIGAVDVKIVVRVAENARANDHHEFRMNNIQIPCFIRGSGYSRDIVDMNMSAEDHQLLEETRRVWVETHECVGRWHTVTGQLVDFLRKCKSLNEALKLWPDISRHIPKEYLDRVAEKPSKKGSGSGAAEALKAVDTDLVNTSTVLARMAGAKV